VKPTVGAAALIDAYPYLTRLYATLSPEDMSLDPVFSFNLGLPEVRNEHEATLPISAATSEERPGDHAGAPGDGAGLEHRLPERHRHCAVAAAPVGVALLAPRRDPARRKAPRSGA